MRFKKIQISPHSVSREVVAARIAEALRHSVLIHVCPDAAIDEPLNYWEDVIGRIGSAEAVGQDESGKQLEGKSIWVDVRFDPRYNRSFRYFNSAQPLHTDRADLDEHFDTAFFYCASQAPSGGATLFLDVEDLVQVVKEENRSLYEDLTTTPVHFSKLGRAGKTCPIIDIDRGGLRVSWNYYRVTPGQGERIDQLRENFHQFLSSRFVDQGAVVALRLEAHESVFFQDTRVLHGRHAYKAEVAGDRLIWKCYFTRLNEIPKHAANATS
jgi:alpha-ketoglutarate-dependent taurine dioxygenase